MRRVSATDVLKDYIRHRHGQPHCHTPPCHTHTYYVHALASMKWVAPLVVVAAALCVASVQAACTSTLFTEVTDVSTGATKCIYFYESKQTWDDAQSFCGILGAQLAKLTGDFHQAVIEEIYNRPQLTDEAFWLGGSDEASEGNWFWTDGEAIPLGTPHWYPCNDQPNHGTAQNHLALWTPDFFFHSINKADLIYSICETPSV